MGYIFDGWYKEADCFNAWNFDADVVMSRTTLYAKWLELYTITFDTQDGSTLTSIYVAQGKLITQPVTPTRDGYNFGGWYRESGCINLWNFATDVVMGNTYIYAKWIENINICTVTFDSRGGNIVPAQNVTQGSKVMQPANPTRIGYIFEGWYKEEACVNVWDFAADVVNVNTELYANWVTMFIVTFDHGDGNSSTQHVAPYGKAQQPADLLRAGYVFDGWYSDAACTIVWDFTTQTVTNNLRLYAKWLYVVIFDSQGGSNVIPQNVAYGEKLVMPTDPTRTGFVFGGWYKEAACTNAWNFNSDLIATTNMTLYAKWLIGYIVTFDTQGGSAIPQQYVGQGNLATQPVEPFWEGYVFDNWYQEASCANIWNFNANAVTANTMLYAKWQITVSFDSQGGSAVTSQAVDQNGKVMPPADPVRDGYVFGGWYREASYTNAWNFANDVVTSVMTLYAKWQFMVTFDWQYDNNVTLQQVDQNGLTSQPDTPVRDGIAFDGWYREKDFTTLWNFATDAVMSNITLYAKWQYFVSFDSQGGSDVVPQNVDQSGRVPQPTAPVKQGFVFGGWYKEADCINVWDFANDMPTTNTTLYAKWQYVITFNSLGGSDVGSQNVDQNGKATQPVDPTRENFVFGGWYKDENCINVWDFTKDAVTDNMMLYAKWQFSVTFDTQNGNNNVIQIVDREGKITMPDDPVQDLFLFDGWYKEKECINAWNFTTDVVMENTTLYAKWIPLYIVTFNTRDGSAVVSQKIKQDHKVTQPEDPKWEGNIFDGWYKEEACINVWNFDTDLVTENTTIYAKWLLTVTFDTQGGSIVAPQILLYGGKVTQPENPSQTGLIFSGWYKEAACNNQWNFATDIATTSITLYSGWLYTVTFNSLGGSNVASQNLAKGEKVTQPPNPTKSGLIFDGWYKEEECINSWNFDTDVIAGHTTLYAKWFAFYTVTFNSQGGSDALSQTVAQGDKVTQPEAPTRLGFFFEGWYKEDQCQNIWNFATDVVTGNITLYAKWTVINVVTFDSRGGTAVPAQNVRSGEKVTQPPEPTRNGWIFTGWYKEFNYMNEWDFATDVVAGNITLYAYWTQVTSVEINQAPIARIYPNPTMGAFTLEFDTEKTYHLTITDMNGKVLSRQTVADRINQMNIHNFAVGVYLLIIDDGKRQTIMRIVKE